MFPVLIFYFNNYKSSICQKKRDVNEICAKEVFSSMVNFQKFGTLVGSSCLPKQPKQHTPRSDCFCRRSLIRVFPVCYSDIHFVNSSLDNQHFTWEQKQKSVHNFRTFIVLIDFSLTVKAATLIFMPWHGSAISSAKQRKSGSNYGLVKN